MNRLQYRQLRVKTLPEEMGAGHSPSYEWRQPQYQIKQIEAPLTRLYCALQFSASTDTDLAYVS
jgi:hypothetical protein